MDTLPQARTKNSHMQHYTLTTATISQTNLANFPIDFSGFSMA